jgi:hypothetical protein
LEGKDHESIVDTQKRVFTLWCNSHLRKTSSAKVNDLYVDFEDGTILYALLESLHGSSLRGLGKIEKNPRFKMQKIANLNICFKYLRETVKLVGIGETGLYIAF